MFYVVLPSFFASLAVTLILTPPLAKVASRLGLFDPFEGDELKIHTTPIPYIGGVAMFAGVAAGLFPAAQSYPFELLGILLGGLLVFAFGFWDDWRWKHISQRRPYRKFALLIALPVAAALTLHTAGIGEGLWSLLVLFFLIFVFINAVNYEDGMDGLAGGFAFLSSAAFLVLSVSVGDVVAALVSTALVGTTLGFLVFNFPPAKVFMGDSGAYMLGLFLAVPVILLAQGVWGSAALLLVMGMFLVDGVLTNIRRVLAGTSIFIGDRGHFFDRLLQRGYSARKTLAVSYAAHLLLILAGLGLWFFGV